MKNVDFNYNNKNNERRFAESIKSLSAVEAAEGGAREEAEREVRAAAPDLSECESR